MRCYAKELYNREIGSLSLKETLHALNDLMDRDNFKEYAERLHQHLEHSKELLRGLDRHDPGVGSISSIFDRAGLYHNFGSPLHAPFLKTLIDYSSAEVAEHTIKGKIINYAFNSISPQIGSCDDWQEENRKMVKRLAVFSDIGLSAIKREDEAFALCSTGLLRMSLNYFALPECKTLAQEILSMGHEKEHEIRDLVCGIRATSIDDFSTAAAIKFQRPPNVVRRLGQAIRLVIGG